MDRTWSTDGATDHTRRTTDHTGVPRTTCLFFNDLFLIPNKEIFQNILKYYVFHFLHIFFVWRRGVVVITTAQLHSTKPELRFCAGSNPAHGVSEIRDGEDL